MCEGNRIVPPVLVLVMRSHPKEENRSDRKRGLSFSAGGEANEKIIVPESSLDKIGRGELRVGDFAAPRSC